MELILALFVVCMFLMGLGTTGWLFFKMLSSLGTTTPPTPRSMPPYPSRVYPSAAPAGPIDPNALAHVDRAEVLSIVQREISSAASYNEIDRRTYLEVRRYIDRQRESLKQRETIAPIPFMPPIPLSLAQGSSAGSEGQQEGGELTLAPHPAQVSDTPRALPPEVKTEPTPQPRDPERIRAAIAKLHADAQAPAVPELPPSPVVDELSLMPVVETKPIPRPVAVAPTPTPKVVKKPWAERLFTPENVRILQSIGICIIFISAAAFVRTRMWNDASDMTRVAILFLGTVACSATGYAMRRWLSLRITGLGFLILGQLSLILDTYSTLIGPGTGSAIYPYSPASLWTLSFIFFTLMAAGKARLLKEPLFDAFTYFGGLAAWGSAALWMGVDPYLIPATFVLALGLSAALSPWLKTHCVPAADLKGEATVPSNMPRWTLPWWGNAGFQTGTALLAFILPIAALMQGRESLAANYPKHALAIGGLALAIYVYTLGDSKRLKIHPFVQHAASLLLLVPAPLAAYAFQWPLPDWAIAFAAPGACLALLAIILPHCIELKEKVTSTLEQLVGFGLVAAFGGLIWTLASRMCGEICTASLWSVGCALVVALALALLEDASWATWLSTACVAFEALLCLEYFKLPMEQLPLLWLVIAGISSGLWTLSKREHGRTASDILAALSAGLLLFHTSILPDANGLVPTVLSVSVGWSLLCAYLLMTSIWNRDALRRGLGVAIASPTAVYWLYHCVVGFGYPAPWLAAAVLVSIVVLEVILRSARTGTIAGLAAMAAHAAILATYQSFNGYHAAAALTFFMLGLSPLLLAFSIQRTQKENWAHACEYLALLLIGVAGTQVGSLLHIDPAMRPIAYALLSGGLLALAKLFEWMSRRPDGDSRLPFHATGKQVSLLFSGIAVVQVLSELVSSSGIHTITQLTTTWPVALVPLFIALRTKKNQTQSDSNLQVLGGILATGVACIAAVLTLNTQFWLRTCTGDLRLACATYFGVVLAVSLFGLFAQRRWFSPLSGTLASLGLIGCAFGAWNIPPQSLGLCCTLLGIGLSALAAVFSNRSDENPAQPPRVDLDVVFNLSIAITFIAAVTHLGIGLLEWPATAVHAYAVAAWLMMCGLACATGVRTSFQKSAFASITFCLAVCHAMRWSGLDFGQFGPGLCAAGLLLLLFRDLSRWTSVEPAAPQPLLKDGMVFVSLGATLAGLSFGLWEMFIGAQWLWCLTLAEGALYVAALTMIARRESASIRNAQLVVLELLAWLMLALSIGAVADTRALNLPLAGPAWVLVGILFLLLGMAGETIVSALSGKARPEPFLESRHLAALALGLYSLIDVLFFAQPAAPIAEMLWRTLFGLAAFAIYESFARSTSSERWAQTIHQVAAGAAYLVLLPAGHLALLQANSDGGSWGAMYFMLLAPVLLAASYVLRREKQDDQAALATWGAVGVNAGALILAFAGNRQHLAAVPAVVLGAIALQLLLARVARADRWFTAAACVALAGVVHFGSQALMGMALWETHGPWSMHMPILALFGVAMAIVGGVLNLEETELSLSAPCQRGSLVTLCGVSLTALALPFALIFWIGYGERAADSHYPNTAYFDAVVYCTMLVAAAALCASRWLKQSDWMRTLSQYSAPLATLAGYFMLVLKDPHSAWEWYTLPAAGFLFAWARQVAIENGTENAFEARDIDARAASIWRSNAEVETTIGALLFFASALAVGPSFVQSIDLTHGTVHFITLLVIALSVVFGAMLTRRKIPLMIGTGALIVDTIIKTAQWAHHREGLLPLLGIALGFLLVAVSTLFESRMNQAFHKVVDRARAEARMFWVSWR